MLIARRDRIEAELEQLALTAPWTTGSPGCAACAGSTRSRRWVCAPRSANATVSITRTSSPPTSESCPRSTRPQKRRQGSITKAGSTHARRLLIEASYHYQRRPAITTRSSAANEGKTHRHQHRLASPTTAQRALAPTQTHPQQTTASSRSQSPANSPPSAGKSRPCPTPTHNPCGWRGGPSVPTAHH